MLYVVQCHAFFKDSSHSTKTNCSSFANLSTNNGEEMNRGLKGDGEKEGDEPIISVSTIDTCSESSTSWTNRLCVKEQVKPQ